MLTKEQIDNLTKRLSSCPVYSEPTMTSDGHLIMSDIYDRDKVIINSFNPHVDSDDIIRAIPPQIPVDGDDCQFNLTMMSIDGKPTYVVTYDRISDGWTCCSFTGESLIEVLYNTLVGIDNI